MNKQRPDSSKVEPYRQHQNQPFERTIYLNRQNEEVQPPRSHKHTQHKYSKSSVNPIESLGRSNIHSKGKKLTISRINTKKQTNSIWDIFSCCKDDSVVQSTQYEDCDVCNRRVFHNAEQILPIKKEQEVPYTSIYRLKSRQEKPIQVFYDKLKNHELSGQRWSHE